MKWEGNGVGKDGRMAVKTQANWDLFLLLNTL